MKSPKPNPNPFLEVVLVLVPILVPVVMLLLLLDNRACKLDFLFFRFRDFEAVVVEITEEADKPEGELYSDSEGFAILVSAAVVDKELAVALFPPPDVMPRFLIPMGFVVVVVVFAAVAAAAGRI